MNAIYKIGLASTVVFLISCSSATTTLLPQGNNKYTVETIAASESDARTGAINKANETCKEEGRKLVVIKHKTVYQGAVDQETKSIVNTTEKIGGALSGTFLPSASEDNDYKSTLQFKCE